MDEALKQKLKDPAWRLRNLYSIVDKNSNKVKFTPNAIQDRINIDPSKRKLILKARQFGVSTNCILAQFDFTIFTPNTTNVIIAHEKDAIEKLFRIATRAYKFMPDIVKPRIERGGGSKYEMYFPEINSRIYCDLESRSDTVQWLHISEAAFMKDSSRIKSTLQTVPMRTGRVSVETTPNGLGNHFYDMWSDTESTYHKMFFPWFSYPDYKLPFDSKIHYTDEEIEMIRLARKNYGIQITPEQIAFRRFKKSELKVSTHDKRKVTFEQEYPEDEQSCFLSSGESVIDLFAVKRLLDSAASPISDNGWLKIYEEKKKNCLYVIGADTSEGIGKDFSVGVVINVTNRSVAAKIRGQWKPFLFAQKLKDLADIFKFSSGPYAELAVERNNHGHAVLLQLSEHINYENLYIHTDEKLGWRTDMVTRPIMINTFIDAIENESIRANDKELLSECMTLVDNNGKIEASSGKTDDCIMACSIAIQLMVQKGNLGLYDDLKSKILVG